jgi:hypothetical protein
MTGAETGYSRAKAQAALSAARCYPRVRRRRWSAYQLTVMTPVAMPVPIVAVHQLVTAYTTGTTATSNTRCRRAAFQSWPAR